MKTILITSIKTIGIFMTFLVYALLCSMFPKTMLALTAFVGIFIPVYSFEIHKSIK